MDRFDVIRFADLSGPQGGEWVRIGGGSFGVVFRGEYLGTDVAIKEVLPNNTYDVEKYFERECVLMKEARHPNIVQYIGLTKSPGPDGRIYIISEFVGGNLRSFIADKKKPFDWPLRISFATDIARAVAYLHARNCLHRDLKGENLLITDNRRIKVCDFGFARIAARNEDEMRRISYCGTDGYMSPEILMGVDFGLPSDVFSLGIIFCEIISRRLVDSTVFKRQMPTFGIEADEVHEMADSGCPADFIQLCLHMVQVEPDQRPDMRQVIRRLRAIEQEIISREASHGTLNNIGSVRGTSLAAIQGSGRTSKRSRRGPRLPSFGGVDAFHERTTTINERRGSEGSTSSEEDVSEALAALEQLAVDKCSIKAASTYKVAGHGNPWWNASSESLPSLPSSWTRQEVQNTVEPSTTQGSAITVAGNRMPQADGEYSTSVVRSTRGSAHIPLASSLSKMSGVTAANATASDDDKGNLSVDCTTSTATVRRRAPLSQLNANAQTTPASQEDATCQGSTTTVGHARQDSDGLEGTHSYMTARMARRDGSREDDCAHRNGEPYNYRADPSLALATIASLSAYGEPEAILYHRFTLVKNGVRRPPSADDTESQSPIPQSSRIPYQLILANALTKCSVCNRRLGFNAYMDCDDCPYKTHVACADVAEPNCQELHLPPSRKGSLEEPRSTSGLGERTASPGMPRPKSPATAAAALPSVQEDLVTTKSSPNGLSKGVAIFRKRNSKSPPPKKLTATSPILA